MIKTNQQEQFDQGGIIMCSRYGFMPNHLSFCGPDKNQELFHYTYSASPDAGLADILKKFQTLYPYLKFIAQYNRIRDPFQREVVEAYWLGNHLLENIDKQQLYRHFTENLCVNRKLDKKAFNSFTKKISQNIKPHHNFHVMNVWQTLKNVDISQALASVDLCRISYGEIKEVGENELGVEYRPLIIYNDWLKLGDPIIKKIKYQMDNQGFIDHPKVGQWVTFHWDFACEAITDKQRAYLKKYTDESIVLANS